MEENSKNNDIQMIEEEELSLPQLNNNIQSIPPSNFDLIQIKQSLSPFPMI